MNLHIPDARTLEIHPAPWSTLHPIRRHSSILEERKDLGLPLLLHAIGDAAQLGYDFLNIACEDALRYPGLLAVTREAHRHGMLTSIVTRPADLTAQRMAWLRFSVDLLGVTLEGKAEGRRCHVRSPRALASARRHLALLRDCGIPFAMLFSLTPATLPDLEWAAEFASAEGAAVLQVRPSPELTLEQTAIACGIVECLCDLYRGRPVVHLDSVNLYNLPVSAGDLASWKHDLERESRYLGEIVSPLVIEEDGTVAPLRRGFPRHLALGNLNRDSLPAMTSRWIEFQADAFCDVYGKVVTRARTGGRRFGDLYQMLSQEAGAVGERSLPSEVSNVPAKFANTGTSGFGA